MNANTRLRWNDQLLLEYSNIVWMKETHKCKHIPSHVFVHCYRTPHTPLGDSGKPVFHASHLLMWNDTQSQMSPSGHRTAAGSVFTYVCSFTSLFSTALIDVFLFTCCFDKQKQTFIMTNSNPQKIPQTDCSGIIFIDIRVSLTFDLITCSL